MAKVVRFKGSNIFRPGFATFFNFDALVNVDLTSEATVIVIGEAAAGQPMTSLASPVYHMFTSADAMINTFQSGSLAEMARFLFDPIIAGQREQGVDLKGASTVIAIKCNPSTQASFAVKDATGVHTCFTLKDRLWGALGNNTWFKIMTDTGPTTGLRFIAGRNVAPNIGSQDSEVTGQRFSITGVDEWISVTTAAGFAGATCTFDYGTTVPGHVTLNSNVAADDLDVDCTGKTVAEVVAAINAFAPAGIVRYSATVLRSDRANVLYTYSDIIGATNCFAPAVAKSLGVSYDMVTWINAECDYLEATWSTGYEPTTYLVETPMAGAVVGDTTATPIDYALKYATRLNANYLASGFSADVSISGSALTLATVNPYFTAHATSCNALGVPRERMVFISNNNVTKAAMYTTLAALNNANVICHNNRLYREGPANTKVWMGPHTLSAACAAICSAAPRATPLLYKNIKAYDFDFLATDFDPTVDADYKNGVNYGLNFVESDEGMIRIANGHTTYSAENNDGYCNIENRIAAMWWKIIQRRFRRKMIGTKGAGSLTATQILDLTNDANETMSNTNDPDFLLVPGTDTDGNPVRAYTGFTCTQSGGTFYIRGQVRFTTGVRFILDDIVALSPTSVVG